MRRLLPLFLVCLTLLASAVPARACGYGAASPLNRFVLADTIVVGRVMSLEDQTIQALPARGWNMKQEYVVALVRIDRTLKGPAGVTHVRVGFTPGAVLRPGEEACFFLTRHFEESFSIPAGGYDRPIRKADGTDFEKRLQPFTRLARLWEEPSAGLQSPDPDDRLLTAGLLISSVRDVWTEDGRRPKPLSADLSRVLLRTLADADWARRGPNGLSAAGLFYQLNPQRRDGWSPEGKTDPARFTTAAKGWLREHADSFRVAPL